jgi:hypothetical protein
VGQPLVIDCHEMKDRGEHWRQLLIETMREIADEGDFGASPA